MVLIDLFPFTGCQLDGNLLSVKTDLLNVVCCLMYKGLLNVLCCLKFKGL